MAELLHIACLQIQPRATMAEAVAEAMPMAEAAVAAGARMLFLPEYCGGLCSDGGKLCPPSAPEPAHPVLAAFRDFAASRSVWVSLGSVAVDGPNGKIFNRGYMIDPSGAVTDHYDKIHMFDVDLGQGQVYRESETITPGDRAVIHDTSHGRIGHTICYDLRFADLYRALAQGGADILICPAAFTKTTGEAHWHILNRARAIENTRFMVSPCAVGPVAGGGECYGHSLVVGPWGEVLADGSTLPGVMHAQLDLSQIEIAENRVPSLTHDREFTLDPITERSVA